MQNPHDHARHNEPILTVHIQNVAYGWDERVDETSLALRRARDRSIQAVSLIGLFVAAVAVLVAGVGAWWYDVPVFSLQTWLTPSFIGAAFSFGTLAACFVVYRVMEATTHRVFVPRRGVEATVGTPTPCAEGEPVHNIARVFDQDAFACVEQAYALAKQYGHAQLLPFHLFATSLGTSSVSTALSRLDLSFDVLKDALIRHLSSLPKGDTPTLSPAAEHTLLASFVDAYTHSRRSVGSLEVFAQAYAQDPFLAEVFLEHGVDAHAVENVVAWIRVNAVMRERYHQFRSAAAFKPTGSMNRAMTSVATPTLDAFSEDLTALAAHGQLPMLVGRDREIDAAFRVIQGGRKSVLFVGPDGTGRTSLLAGIAERMAEERVPAALADKRLVSLSLAHLLSGAAPAQIQERVLAILVEMARSRNIVLAIADIELLTQNTLSADVSALFVDALSRGVTFAIATTTPEAYAQSVERSLLARVFEKVDVPEPALQEAIQIVESKVAVIEYEHHVVFTYGAIEASVQLTDRYLPDQQLPQKAINVCRETAREVASRGEQGVRVTAEDIARVVSEKAAVPLTSVTQNEQDTLLHLEERMRERVVGQSEAVTAVASALRRARTQLAGDHRPMATFLFLGPTGVGKTELAKTVAASYFGSEEAMLRFDMSEYQDQASITRLIGSGEQPGLLTQAVRQRPFAIVLLDEFEKAHPDILNVFLQVFDDGRLTDAQGRTVDFSNTIIVATSNAGSAYIQQSMTDHVPVDRMRTQLMESELRSVYRPELLNRFDGVIVFTPLTQDDVLHIAYLLLGAVEKRLEPKGIRLRATDEAVAELAQRGFDPVFGARPLRRVIQEQVDDAIAKALLEGRLQRRDTVVLYPGGRIEVEKGKEL